VRLAPPDSSSTLIVGSRDNVNPLTPKHYIKAHKLGVVSLSTDAAGTKAISSSIEGTVYLSDLARGKAVAKKATYKEQTEEGAGE
jgi:hypothetical protein